MANGTATQGQAKAPSQKEAAPQLPFRIASRKQTRWSFTTGAVVLQAAAPTNVSPIQIPAVGYLSHINCEVTLTTTSTALTFTADAPFNLLALMEFRTAAGNDIIVPLTGYQVYLMNKYGCQFAGAPVSDNKLSRQYAATTGTNGSAHFFLQIPLEIDGTDAYGSIPALASNRSYQAVFTMAAITTALGGTVTAASVTIDAVAHYWSEPPATTQNGIMQGTQPEDLGTLSQWQIEQPPLTPGDKYVKSNNTGNVLRTLIFTLRNVSGARIDVNGWPALSELYLDNEPMYWLKNTEWEDLMAKWYQFTTFSKDAAGGLDTGVYVLPFYAMASNAIASDLLPRNQYLPTLDASQLQLRGTSWGSASSTLEIITNSVIPRSAANLLGG